MSAESSTTKQREWDLVVYGATGDAGTAIAMYVANNIAAYKKNGADGDDNNRLRWAIAGRSENKLNRLRSRIIVTRLKPSANDEIGVLTADVTSAEDTNKLAKSTRVLVSAVGPYNLLGESIYAACVENGTNYVDVTGEVDWVGKMREKYQKRARETGATLCSFAGYDCVPCDIMLHLARIALSECNNDSNKNITISSAESVVVGAGGVMPRGTIRTSILVLPRSAEFSRQLVRFPFVESNDESDVRWKTVIALVRWLLPKWSPEYGAFTIPHFMGWCNIPVIYNSHSSTVNCTFHDRMALPYSQDFLGTGFGLLQVCFLYAFLLVMAPWYLCLQVFASFVPSTADLLLKIFDSLQYRGNRQNNQQQLDDVSTEVWSYVTSSSGSKATVHLHVQGDPGIKCTALLAVETAFSMLMLMDKNTLPKGVIGSPSMIVGDTLVERLQDEETIGHSCSLTVTVDENSRGNKQDGSSKKES